MSGPESQAGRTYCGLLLDDNRSGVAGTSCWTSIEIRANVRIANQEDISHVLFSFSMGVERFVGETIFILL